MSLSAVVYKRLEDLRLPEGSDARYVEVDGETGEVSLKDSSPVRMSRVDVFEVHKRLGKISRIEFLRKEVGGLLGEAAEASPLLGLVLYNGTHGGESISVKDREAIKREIVFLKGGERHRSGDLMEFLSDMEELVRASELAGNPIVRRERTSPCNTCR
jgi:hypothetical protein